MGAKTISMQDFDVQVQKLGSVGAALNWARENGLELPPANRELPPVEPQGGLKTAEEASTMAADTDEEDTGAEDTGAEDTGAMGALDLANLDFGQIKSDPGNFFKSLLAANQAAEQRAALSSKQLYEEGRKRIMEKYAGPSQSERLFALSRAMLSPTKTPGFAGFLGNVTGALSENAKAAREAEQTREEQLLALQQQYQQGEAARLAARPRTALEMFKAYSAANKPRVARPVGTEVVNGKIVTIMQDPDTGALTKTVIGDAPANLKPIPGQTSGGQPVFMGPNGPVLANGTPVTEFDVKGKQVSATEQRQIFDTEDSINSGLGAVKSLEEALNLNSQAYEGSLSGWRKTLGQLFSSDDPRYVATENFDNVVASGALRDLKAMFGANPTEGERKIYMELQAVSSKPRAVRDAVLRRALDAMKSRIARDTKRLQGLKGGEYSTRGASTAGGTRTIRYDKNGKRINAD